MNWKYLVGKSINDILMKIIKIKPSILVFIPNGRFVELDILRTGESLKTIFDVGANIGQTAISFNKSFPRAKIHSFEPVKNTFEVLKKNCSRLPNIIPTNMALGNERCHQKIILNENSEINSLNNTTHPDDPHSEMILIESGFNYCANNNINHIDLLKIDTEGYELNVIKGFGISFLKDNVKFIYCEVGFNKDDVYKTHFSEVEHYLRDLGFVTSGFYEPSRWGETKLILGFCNVLFTNLKKIKAN